MKKCILLGLSLWCTTAQGAALLPIATPDSVSMEAKTPLSAELRGRITDSHGTPIEGAVLAVGDPQLHLIVRTDREGRFALDGLPTGRQPIVIQAMGYITQRRFLHLGGGGMSGAELHFILDEREQALPTVDVVGRREQSYRNALSFAGTKTATLLKDVPQSIGYVTKELVLDQGAITVNEVVKNISGINQYSFYNDFSIRGFRATGNRNSGNLVNGMRAQTSLWRQSSLANVERVEVIKGPASALFGNAAPGGVINRVTKKPLHIARRSVSLTAGSFNTSRAYVDFTGPLNERKTLLYRLNLGYENSDTFRDLQKLTTQLVAPSITYLPSDRTRLNVDLVYTSSSGKLDRGVAIFGDGDLFSRPLSSSQSAANDYLREQTLNLTFALSHQLSEGLLFNSTYLYSSYSEDMMEHSQDNAFVKKADGTDDPSRVLMRVTKRFRNFRNHAFNNYLTWSIPTGPLQHKLLFGYDHFNTQLAPGSSYIEAGGYLLADGGVAKTFKKADIAKYLLDKDGSPRTNVPAFDLNSTVGNQYQDVTKYLYESKPVRPADQYTNGIYLQEQLSWRRLQLLLGARIEWFTDIVQGAKGVKTYTHQSAFTPRIGLVYGLTPTTNVYATWIRGFEPQAVSVQSDPTSGGPFDPVQSELWELGAKGDYFDSRLTATLSLFSLLQRNTLYNAGITGEPNRMVPIGEELSRGIELDVAGKILPYWSVMASYSYNVAEITKAVAGTKDLNLQRPGTPRHSGNIWTKFVIPQGPMEGLGIGLGVHGVSERLGQVGRREHVVSYPGYVLLDAALYYKVRDVQLQLNANNLLDKSYYVSGYDRLRSFPGSPRHLSISATYRF